MTQSKGLHIGLWVAQGLLAAAFLLSGFMKMTAPMEELAANGMTFVNSFSEWTVRLIGFCEVLGSIGLVLPSLLKIQPILTPVAAGGLALIMVLASIYHIQHGEPIIPNVILFSIAIIVAWGRMVKVRIAARSAS